MTKTTYRLILLTSFLGGATLIALGYFIAERFIG